jgi:alkaline phosphatase D
LQGLSGKNPHIRAALGGVYGYGHLALDAKQALVSFRTVSDVRDPKAGISTAKRFAVEAGKPGAVAG